MSYLMIDLNAEGIEDICDGIAKSLVVHNLDRVYPMIESDYRLGKKIVGKWGSKASVRVSV